MISCLGYIPNLSIEDLKDIQEMEEKTNVIQRIERIITSFSGINSTLFLIDGNEANILAQTDHHALELNERLLDYLEVAPNEEIADKLKQLNPKLILLGKLNQDKSYTLGLLINPQIPLVRSELEPDPILGAAHADQILLFQTVPFMRSQPNMYSGSQLELIVDELKEGKKFNFSFLWHDFMPGEITTEKLMIDMEILGKFPVEFVWMNNPEMTWADAVQEAFKPYLVGNENVQLYLHTDTE